MRACVLRNPVADPEKFNHGIQAQSFSRVKGGGGGRGLVVCHCFSECLIKARKYGPAMPVEQRSCLELMTGDTVRVGRVGSGGPAVGSCGIATKISGPS